MFIFINSSVFLILLENVKIWFEEKKANNFAFYKAYDNSQNQKYNLFVQEFASN